MKKPICVQSSYYPEGWKDETFNDLACHHASRGPEGFFRRMMAAAKEFTNNQSYQNPTTR